MTDPRPTFHFDQTVWDGMDPEQRQRIRDAKGMIFSAEWPREIVSTHPTADPDSQLIVERFVSGPVTFPTDDREDEDCD